MMEDGFRLENITVSSGGKQFLSNISMDIPGGRVLLVAGRSGSGKSTLGRLLTGLIPHQYPAEVKGSIQLAGDNLLEWLPEKLTGRIAHVAAEPWSRFFQITVRDELAFGPRNLGWPESKTVENISRTSCMLEMNDLLDRRIDTLSAGQMQKLSIGTALVMDSRWLILDEPSAFLDLEALHGLTDILGEISGVDGPGIVLLEHRIGEFARIADDVAILEGGKLVFRGSRLAFEDMADELCTKHGLRHPGLHDPSEWAEIIGNEPDHAVISPMFEMRGISFQHGRTKILDSIDLDVRPGEIFAMAGPNGSGKTTLGRIATGLLKPDRGEITLDGKRIGSPDGRNAGMLFQNPSSMLFFDNVRDEILSGPANHRIELEVDSLERVVESMSLAGLLDSHPQRLSRGQRLRVAVAAVMILRPRLVVLDEPIRGQDWRSLSGMMGYLREYVSITGGCCILITHEYKLISHFADRVALLDGGTIRAVGPPVMLPDEERCT